MRGGAYHNAGDDTDYESDEEQNPVWDRRPFPPPDDVLHYGVPLGEGGDGIVRWELMWFHYECPESGIIEWDYGRWELMPRRNVFREVPEHDCPSSIVVAMHLPRDPESSSEEEVEVELSSEEEEGET